MKKLVSMMLALTFAASCAAPAFAAPAPLLSETETVPEYATQAAVGMTEAEIQEYAHMDIDTAVNELKAKILSARNSFIGSTDWYDERYCGGASYGSIDDPEGTAVALPAFHDLFPADWVNPGPEERAILESAKEAILPKTQAEKRYYAYLNQDKAVQSLKDKIITARNELIYRQDWAADGYTVYCVDPTTGESELLPAFSDLFPGWDLPVEPISNEIPVDNEGISPQSITRILYGRLNIPPARNGVTVSPIGQAIPTYGYRWIRIYGTNYENTDLINLGFSHPNGTSLCHRRNATERQYLDYQVPPVSTTTPSSIRTRFSHYQMSNNVYARIYLETEPV